MFTICWDKRKVKKRERDTESGFAAREINFLKGAYFGGVLDHP